MSSNIESTSFTSSSSTSYSDAMILNIMQSTIPEESDSDSDEIVSTVTPQSTTSSGFQGPSGMNSLKGVRSTRVRHIKPRRRLDKMNDMISRSLPNFGSTKEIETNLRPKVFKVQSNDATAEVNLLNAYLNWSFEASFFSYLVSALAIFLIQIAFCSFLIILAVTKGAHEATPQDDSTCFENMIAGKDFNNLYSSAFTLSWTTFSTVGYGQIYHNLGAKCGIASIIADIISFFGNLYSDFAVAIVFGKVLSVYSRANVVFSDICILRYGTGIINDTEDLSNDIEDEKEEEEINALVLDLGKSLLNKNNSLGTPKRMQSIFRRTMPCPVLLFRITNNKANYSFGDIMNLKIDVGCIVIRRTDQSDKNRMRRQIRNLKVLPKSVPVFDKILYIRHVLNADSPLINIETRKMILRNNGKWAAMYDSREKIRETLHFSQLNISLQGISDVSLSTVYANKTYDIDEVMVGYKFVDMTFKDQGSKKKNYYVDFSLVNCISEQVGGRY